MFLNCCPSSIWCLLLENQNYRHHSWPKSAAAWCHIAAVLEAHFKSGGLVIWLDGFCSDDDLASRIVFALLHQLGGEYLLFCTHDVGQGGFANSNLFGACISFSCFIYKIVQVVAICEHELEFLLFFKVVFNRDWWIKIRVKIVVSRFCSCEWCPIVLY